MAAYEMLDEHIASIRLTADELDYLMAAISVVDLPSENRVDIGLHMMLEEIASRAGIKSKYDAKSGYVMLKEL